MKARNRRAGLTLIEVVLALMIIGTGLVALVAAVSRCLSIPRLALNYDSARELLGKLEAEEPLALEEDIESAAGSGSFDAPFSNFRWQRDIESVGNEEDGLWMVTTTIRWQDNNRDRNEQVVTYIYRSDKKGGSVTAPQ